jgi:hypothetical protein
MTAFVMRPDGSAASWLFAEVGCRGAKFGLQPHFARCGGFDGLPAMTLVHVVDTNDETWCAWDAIRRLSDRGAVGYAQPFLCGALGSGWFHGDNVAAAVEGAAGDCSRCVELAKERMGYKP